MKPEGIGPQQTPAAVNMEALRAEAEVLAKSFEQDRQLKGFAEKITSVLKDPGVEENLKSHVFDQLQPADLEGKPEQLKAAQRFISQFPSVAKRVQFGEQKEAHPLLVQAAVGPIFREMMGHFTETETIQSIADKLSPEMRLLFHEYFEKGTVSPTIAQVPELIKLADQFHITGLLEVARKNIVEHKVLEKLTAAQANEWLELGLNRNIGWLQLTLLQEMKKREIAADPNKPKLVALCALYNIDKKAECLSLTTENQIKFTCWTEQDFQALKQFNSAGLRIESLVNDSTDGNLNAAVIGTLNQLKSLKELSCRNCLLGNQAASQLAEALKTNLSIRKLSLEHNEIGDQGATDIANALKVNETLYSLDLGFNRIFNQGATALAEALKSNSALEKLLLGHNAIGSEGASRLAEALQVNTTLTNLDMRANLVTLEGCKQFAQALMINRTLTRLDLYRTVDPKDGDNLASWISEALSKNNVIKYLSIGKNGISAEGTRVIAGAVSQHPSLDQLHLEDNPIQDEGVKHLAEMLEQNSRLSFLRLNHCGISDVGANQLAEALTKNATLVFLDLMHNNFGKEGAEALRTAMLQDTPLRIRF